MKKQGHHVRHYKSGRARTVNPNVPRAALKFYDLRGKKSFMTSNYKIVMKSGRKFAVATAPSGISSWHIMGKG